jgi:CHAD domain-containing protein
MAYRLTRAESVSQGVKRVATEQLEKAQADLANDQSDHHETVHQVRKRFKKLRGLIRLVRPAFEKTYQRENANFRDVGRELSAVRDAQSLIEGFDRLAADGQFAQIREHLVQRRTRIAGEQTDLSEVLAELTEDIQQAMERVADWEFKDRGFDAIAGGFEQTYSRAQQAMEHAGRKKASAEDFHEWRKHVKYHWHHCRLLANLWKPLMKVRCDETKQLAERLGEDHDYAMLDHLLRESPADFPVDAETAELLKVIASAQRDIRKQAFLAGQRLFAQKPKHVSREFGAWWSAWRGAA